MAVMAVHQFAQCITCHAWSPDQSMVALCPNNNEVHIYRLVEDKWEKVYVLQKHDQVISGIDWSARSNRIVTASHDRNSYVWNLEGSEWVPTLVILRLNRAALCVEWSPKENKFAVGSGAKTVCICYYEQENNWWVSKLIRKRHDSSVTSVSWHPDNILLATTSTDGKCRVFSTFIKGVDAKDSKKGTSSDSKFGELIVQLDLSSSWTFGVKWSPSGNTLASFVRYLGERKAVSSGSRYGSQFSEAFGKFYGQSKHGVSNDAVETSRTRGTVHENCINCIMPLGDHGTLDWMEELLYGIWKTSKTCWNYKVISKLSHLRVIRQHSPSAPCFDHLELKPLPLKLGSSDSTAKQNKKTCVVLLKLTQGQVGKLKKKANDQPMKEGSRVRPYSRFEAIAAHIWRCASKARELDEKQPTLVRFNSDIRSRQIPPLPRTYFGNALAATVTPECCVGDILSKSLSYAAQKVREAIEMLTNEYIRSQLDIVLGEEQLDCIKALFSGQGERRNAPFAGNPNLQITSWMSIPLYEADFGWGKPDYVVMGYVCLFDRGIAHMHLFKKFFYEDVFTSRLIASWKNTLTTTPSPSGLGRIPTLSSRDPRGKPNCIGFPQPKSASYTGMVIKLIAYRKELQIESMRHTP
ncbi:Actin-related protein 2/3 complex subunit 1A [Glycine max]|nr:Actin-related protein 2/3 complex subunit 1A [Glycine max]